MINYKDFSSAYQMVKFCNEQNITKEQIIQIIHVDGAIVQYVMIYEKTK